jgi:excisionase family DNA binding protein
MKKPTDNANKRDFYTLQEAADKLHISQRSVFRYIHDNKLHAIKTGYWRIPKESYKKFLRENSNFQEEVAKFRKKKK